MKKILGLTSILLTTGFAAFAFTPSYDTFGTLSDFTVGSGNPNDAFAISTYTSGGNTVTLGLQAQQRYANPALVNDGAGTFSATPGFNDGLDVPAHSMGPTWNFDVYLKLVEAATTAPVSYAFRLQYGKDGSPLSTLNLGSATAGFTYQDSWNLSMTSFLNIVPAFDPYANGQYDFQLDVLDAQGAVIKSAAIVVNVGTVPDTASTAMLLGLGFAGLMVFGLRQNRLQVAK